VCVCVDINPLLDSDDNRKQKAYARELPSDQTPYAAREGGVNVPCRASERERERRGKLSKKECDEKVRFIADVDMYDNSYPQDLEEKEEEEAWMEEQDREREREERGV
jgi:hypothetical protein